MLNLYIKTYCPYCQRVLRANDSLKAPLNLIDIMADLDKRNELVEKGGKGQVPYLEDTDTGISMYESLDIIEYLKNNFSKQS